MSALCRIGPTKATPSCARILTTLATSGNRVVGSALEGLIQAARDGRSPIRIASRFLVSLPMRQFLIRLINLTWEAVSGVCCSSLTSVRAFMVHSQRRQSPSVSPRIRVGIRCPGKSGVEGLSRCSCICAENKVTLQPDPIRALTLILLTTALFEHRS